jgi:hypothetical protein
MRDEAVALVKGLAGVSDVAVNMTAEVRQSPQMDKTALKGVKNIVAVGSGKGGDKDQRAAAEGHGGPPRVKRCPTIQRASSAGFQSIRLGRVVPGRFGSCCACRWK